MKDYEADIGSLVRIRSSKYDETYQIVEPQDVDPFTHRISLESPLGRALHHKHKNDLVHIEAPHNRETYLVVDVAPQL